MSPALGRALRFPSTPQPTTPQALLRTPPRPPRTRTATRCPGSSRPPRPRAEAVTSFPSVCRDQTPHRTAAASGGGAVTLMSPAGPSHFLSARCQSKEHSPSAQGRLASAGHAKRGRTPPCLLPPPRNLQRPPAPDGGKRTDGNIFLARAEERKDTHPLSGGDLCTPALEWGQGKGVDGTREGNHGLSLRAAVPGRVSASPGPVSRPSGLTRVSCPGLAPQPPAAYLA